MNNFYTEEIEAIIARSHQCETHEKELFKKWLSIYHLSEQAGMAAFSNRHPAADLLREMLV